MPLKLEKYRHHLDGYDMSEAHKTEFIKAIAIIAESLADKAFGLDSIHCIYPQKAPENCSSSFEMVKSLDAETLIDKCANDNEISNPLKKANGKRK